MDSILEKENPHMASLPPLWKLILDKHISKSQEDSLLSGISFPINGVLLIHEDGTFLYFKYAFYLVDKSVPNEVCIFTEHNGYHVFPFYPEDIIVSDVDHETYEVLNKNLNKIRNKLVNILKRD